MVRYTPIAGQEWYLAGKKVVSAWIVQEMPTMWLPSSVSSLISAQSYPNAKSCPLEDSGCESDLFKRAFASVARPECGSPRIKTYLEGMTRLEVTFVLSRMDDHKSSGGGDGVEVWLMTVTRHTSLR
jgi:hypothetical protein